MKNWGIRYRVLVITVAPALVIALLLGGYFMTSQLNALQQTLHERGQTIAHSLAPAAEYGVFSGNRVILESLARAAAAESDVRSIAITDTAGNILAAAGLPLLSLSRTPAEAASVAPKLSGDSAALVFHAPIRPSHVAIEDYLDASIGGNPALGWVYVELSLASTTARRNEILARGLAITLLVLLATAAIGHRLGRQVSNPILDLKETVRRIGQGELEAEARTDAGGELNLLAAGINTMAESLRKSRDQLEVRVQQATAELRNTLSVLAAQNREISQAREEAERASRIKSEFVANVSHELRTPLNGFLGFLELLRETPLDTLQRDYADTIHASAQQLLALINDLLDFSKIEAGRLSLEHTAFALRELVRTATAGSATGARAKGLRFDIAVQDRVPEWLIGDPLRLAQILANLVSNAVKFTANGEIRIQVDVGSIAGSRATLVFSVSDTGVGMTAAQQAQLFRPFSQADSSITRRYGGSGLGLAISKRLVELMDGAIGVQSRAGSGARFWFRVPLDIAPAPVAERRPESAAVAAAEPGHIRALVVDDNAINLKLAAAMLTKLGVETVAVESGVRAVEEFGGDRFDIVLTDIYMPDMDGIETARRIRALDHAGHQTPIIALTANAMAGDRERFLAEGMSDYLPKPLTQRALLDVLARWVPQPDRALAAPTAAPETPAASASAAALDEAAGIALSGGDPRIWRQVMRILLDELPGQMARIEQTFAASDLTGLRAVTHQLAGSTAYSGTAPLHDALLELERTCIARDRTRIEPGVRAVRAEVGRLIAAARNL